MPTKPLSRVLVLTSLLLTGLLAMASGAAALPKIHLQPAQPLGYEGTALRVATFVPCGTHFFGIVAVPDMATRTLRLAAAVVEDAIVCTSMPERLELGIGYLGTAGFTHVEALPADEQLHARLVAIEDVRALPGKAGSRDSLVDLIYLPHCGTVLGTLVHHAGAGRLELAVVEADTAPNHKAAPCVSAPTARRLTWLSAAAAAHAGPLRERPKALVRSYDLRLLAPTSAQVSAAGAPTANYTRACNEAPIGLVLGRGRDGVTAHIGVLVAHYFNMRCPEGLPATTADVLTDAGLSLPRALVLAPLPTTTLGLRLRSPTRLVVTTPGIKPVPAARQLTMAYLGTCEEALAVYSRDALGTLAVGVLTLTQSTPGFQVTAMAACAVATSERQLRQPFLAAQTKAAGVFPLRLSGPRPFGQ